MGFGNFFSQVANNFMNHYRNMTDSVTFNRTPKHYTNSDTTVQPEKQIPTDSYIPTDDSHTQTEAPTTATDRPKTDSSTYTNPAAPNDEALPADTETGDVSYFIRKARLDYKMTMQFDLAAIQSIAEKISDGETEELAEFAAAGFGLHAAFDVKGMEIIETNMADKLDYNGSVKYRSKDKSMFAQKFGAQSKNFNLQSFYRESSDVSRSMKVDVFDNYRRSVNKFALRYRLDSNFSFGFMNKFNVQTKQIAETDPANLNSYVTSAGNVAETSTPEMMATFFDTVDSYLNAAESDLRAKAEEFFTMATEQLGFAEETVSQVRDQLLGSIDSFFGRVDEAVGMLASKFVTPEIQQPEADIIVPEIPTTTEDKAEIAIA